MFKVAWLARFPTGMSDEEARVHWRDVHGPLCLRSSIERYVQNQMLEPIGLDGPSTNGTRGFDGYSCGWWSDQASYEATMRTPEWDRLLADGPNVFDMDWLGGMSAVLDEQVKQAPPAEWAGTDRGRFKVVWVIRFKPGLDRAEAHEYWSTRHAALALEVKEIAEGAYVQNHVVHALGDDLMPTDASAAGFDGFSECWFEDRAAYERMLASPGRQALVEDGRAIFDMDVLYGGMSGVFEERVMR